MAMSRKKKIIIGSIAGVVLLGVVIGSIYATRKDTAEVTVVKVETKPFLKSTVTASGEVRPIQFQNLTSEVQGRIIDIYVKEGQMVNKGDPLVKLDPNQIDSSTDAQLAAYRSAQNDVEVAQSQVVAAQYQLGGAQQQYNVSVLAVENARQGLVTAQTEVDRAQKALDIALRELKRSTQLVESGVESRQNFDAAKDQVDNARVELRAAQARYDAQKIAVREATARANQQKIAVQNAEQAVKTAQYNVQTAQSRAEQQAAVLQGQQSQQDKTLQIAPISGVVAEIPSRVGTFAVAGLSTTPLLTIADMSVINVEVKVDETEIDKVAVGQRAKVKVDAFGDQEIDGEVTQKTPLAVGKTQTAGGLSTNINVQEAKEFRVVIQLSDTMPAETKLGLRPGMSATAVITTEVVANVIAVPLQAIVEKKPEGSPEPTVQTDASASSEKPKPIKGVYVLEGNKAKFRPVETGITGETDIQITSGLSEGEEVITGPSRVLNTLKEDTVVKKQEKKEGDSTPK